MAKQKLDLNNIGAWPRSYQLGFCGFVVALIVGLAWLLLFRGQSEELTNLEQKESELRGTFEKKASDAANLEPLKAQLAQMEIDLKQMLRQLPSRTEMPDMIVDISQSALGAGLRVDSFKPGDEHKQDVYAEKPIDISLAGSFHQFGDFMSRVASLPRVVIMNMTNVALTPRDKSKGGGLEMKGTVKTYRYLDETEVQADAKAEADKKKAEAKK
ncbi:type 4a pilus biogenesis protein PilO [Lysobacter soyae]|jgi:type IV pilus assembly protein PilO|uniref:Type 4a pilus biogenesis protein PilO n=1 Tax=Lysobacter soyae TaxID=2764185 RepID=A0ABX8WRB1_9GAMM|nr:type 4a pilus biogenesis protein PilO [Lysobacter sp. CJ11]QYR53377.1 type 4a pilus biogenesis protein PilO [Lysobacter sp. CJ11]